MIEPHGCSRRLGAWTPRIVCGTVWDLIWKKVMPESSYSIAIAIHLSRSAYHTGHSTSCMPSITPAESVFLPSGLIHRGRSAHSNIFPRGDQMNYLAYACHALLAGCSVQRAKHAKPPRCSSCLLTLLISHRHREHWAYPAIPLFRASDSVSTVP